MPFVKGRGREAADGWATVPPWYPSAGEHRWKRTDGPQARAPVRPEGSSV